MTVNYQKRQNQKSFFLRLGQIGTPISFVLASIGIIFFDELTFLASVGTVLFYLSVSFGLVFSRIGWSKNIIIDFLFNQLCIIVAFFGFFLVFLFLQFGHDMLLNIGRLLVVVSFLMVWIGTKLQSPYEDT